MRLAPEPRPDPAPKDPYRIPDTPEEPDPDVLDPPPLDPLPA